MSFWGGTHATFPNDQAATSRLARDDRGAVMVLGIFMCATLVGALWYIAGVGDAIVYRERLQEAADAAALSGAVLHARGMNLLVLINLIMACVLAIRVALKVFQLIMIFGAVIFTGLSLIPGAGTVFIALANLFREGARLSQVSIQNTREPINNTLKGLHQAAEGIAHVIPGASTYGSLQVVDKYKPFITFGLSAPFPERVAKAPVVDGTTDRLCGQAGEAVGDIIFSVVPISIGEGMGVFKDLMAKIVSSGTGYFCELGGSSQPPDLSGLTNETAQKRCDSEVEKRQKELANRSAEWHAACDAAGVTCIDEGIGGNSEMRGLEVLRQSQRPEDKETLANLNKLKDARDAAEDDLDSFDVPKCIDQQKKELKKELDTIPPAEKGNGQGMEPMKVDPKWANGVKDAQMLAYVRAGDGFLKRSPKGVRIGAMKDKRAAGVDFDTPMGADFSYAQAEYFYDCVGAWTSTACNAGKSPYNDDEEAMWHLTWRARLRRYNRPFNVVDKILDALIIARLPDLADGLARNLSTDPGNLARRAELVNVKSLESFEVH